MQKTIAFFRDNLPVAAIILFLLVAGIASGCSIAKLRYGEEAAAILASIPKGALFPNVGVLLLPLLLGALLASGAILSGLSAPALLLWPFLLFGRGFLLGVGLYLGIVAFPSWRAAVLLLWLLLEGGILFMSLLPLYGMAGERAIRHIPFTPEALGPPCRGLMLAALLEGLSLPLAFKLLL